MSHHPNHCEEELESALSTPQATYDGLSKLTNVKLVERLDRIDLRNDRHFVADIQSTCLPEARIKCYQMPLRLHECASADPTIRLHAEHQALTRVRECPQTTRQWVTQERTSNCHQRYTPRQRLQIPEDRPNRLTPAIQVPDRAKCQHCSSGIRAVDRRRLRS